MEEEAKYEVKPVKAKGIAWENFKPVFDSKTFAKAMRAAGLTDHNSVTANQQTALDILRTHWQLSMAAVNDYARKNG